MDICRGCSTTEPVYEIRSHEAGNEATLQAISDFLHRKGLFTQRTSNEDPIRIRESGLADFYDFSQDHLDVDGLSFRLQDQAWRPLRDIPEVLQDRWVDPLIDENRVVCWAQPILDRNGRLYAHEMLARFQQADGTLVQPYEVFTAAKRRNRLFALDKICRMAAVRQAVHLPAKVFINFIPTSIYSPQHCLKSTISLSRQLGMDPSKFVFEVVETEQVEQLDHLKSILAYYKSQQFRYALDDVGEGFSTMELLREIEPHYMKLDRKYVHEVADSKEKQGMAVQMLEAALEVGSIPLAEGVEREVDYEWLRERGYQLFQGYLFGRPQPVLPDNPPDVE